MSKFDDFAKLHVAGNPLVLFNAWDPGSAIAVAKSGARAIATGSASVSMANGFGDGQEVPIDLALANATRIVSVVDVPVTVDFEGGYASDPAGLTANARRLAETGAVGCNFEDQIVGTDRLYDIAEQVGRLKALREGVGTGFFINLRTDIFLKAKPETHDLLSPLQRSSAGRLMQTLARTASSFRVLRTSRWLSGSAAQSRYRSTQCTSPAGRAGRNGQARASPASAMDLSPIWRCRIGSPSRRARRSPRRC